MSSYRNLVDELFVSWVCDVTPDFRWCAVRLYPIAWSLWTKSPETESTNSSEKVYTLRVGAQINKKKRRKKLIMSGFGFMSNKSQSWFTSIYSFHVSRTTPCIFKAHTSYTPIRAITGRPMYLSNEHSNKNLWLSLMPRSFIVMFVPKSAICTSRRNQLFSFAAIRIRLRVAVKPSHMILMVIGEAAVGIFSLRLD